MNGEQNLDEKIIEAVGGECQRRWPEFSPRGKSINVVCGHPMPCPAHTNLEQWKKERLAKIKKAVREHDLVEIEKQKHYDYEGKDYNYHIGYNAAYERIRKYYKGESE